MNHLLILPILLPLLTGALLLILPSLEKTKRTISVVSTLALLPVSLCLLNMAGDDQLRSYALGGWQAPFGIVLLLDRLSAWMLLAVAVLASVVVLYSLRGDDRIGPRFHALLQFQLLGLNGSFLTGDLFNLFVFFEVMLIASYSLLLHGQSTDRVRAGMHYVILNLVGSALFLIALAMIYGLAGSLNMADLAQRVGQMDADRVPLMAAAGLILLLVFALKAALLPLYFWLPKAYASACASVAALFAIMTKVGVYAILRVYTLVFGVEAGLLSGLADPWLWPLGLATVVLGACGALAARTLQEMLAYLVVVSAGTLLAAMGSGEPAVKGAALYYLLHSTWVAGAMFLLADLIVRQRGLKDGLLVQGPALKHPMLLGGMFFFGAIALAGLPPLSGFFAKLFLLSAWAEPWWWGVLLVSGFVTIVGFSRAGSTLFWRVSEVSLDSAELDRGRLIFCMLLLSSALFLVALAEPLQRYAQATAEQLHDLTAYRALVQEVQR